MLIRFLVLFSTGLLLLAISGCVTVLEDVDKSSQPVSAGLLRQMKSKGMTPADPVLVRIFKEESQLEIWKRDQTGRYALLKTYPICRWSGQLGPKTQDGDRQAPEGFYRVTAAMLNPRSDYYLSFNLGYPNRLEKAQGDTGSELMVHGACSSSGCYALTDRGMAEIYPVIREALAAGQKAFQVQALPFHMTAENMAKHAGDPNFVFWSDLKEGYDIFDVSRREPSVSVCGGRYVFDTQFPSGEPRNPLAPCPAGVKTMDAAVAAREAADAPIIARARADASSLPLHAYVDGSMNPFFRSILRSRGAAKLAAMTSLTDVPVSRPEAALVDPHE